MTKIGVAADHAGFELKEVVKTYLLGRGIEVMDFGTNSSESIDYPDVAHPLANAVASGRVKLGVAICGSGNGINMTVNKHQGIRAALCWNSELSTLARLHNDANILSLPARFITVDQAIQILSSFLEAEFEGGRHTNRVNKITCR
ncbi:MAG: ribose 5-phosphate isomerase B [Bacteroidales bacterium]|nr:ribose 5-phosphate isomerase B [Bacteroidales bacterium]